jgi:ribosomal protein S18 acetylase RimI-like enzyme
MDIAITVVRDEWTLALAQVWHAANAARGCLLTGDMASTQAQIRGRMEDGSAFFLAAFDGETPIGTVHALAARHDDGGARRIVPGLIHVSMLAVLPQRQGTGIGRRLLVRCLELAKERRYTAAQLWVATDNATAIGLYTSLGFIAGGRQKHDDRGARIAHYTLELGDPTRLQ